MVSNEPRAFRVKTSFEEAPAPTTPSPAPRAFAIEPDPSLETLLAEEEVEERGEAAPAPKRHGFAFGRVLAAALAGLVVLAVSTAIERYVASLFKDNPWLGGLALLLAVIALAAVIGLAAREVVAILYQRRIAALRRRAAELAGSRDVAGGAALVAELAAIYAHRPDTAEARAELARLGGDVLDPSERFAIAEEKLIVPLDAEARRLVAAAAQRSSVVTALAPRAVFDVLFVAGQSLFVIRKVSETYGSRPGLVEFLALSRRVLSHLAITGGMAVGDSLLQQLVGHGIAARISAKLGEGVLNGLLTARVGLAAIEACRPLPFTTVAAPKLVDVAGALRRKVEAAVEEQDKI